MAKTLLAYGESSSYKTSNIGEFIEWMYARYGVPVRGLFGDNYGPLRRQIDDGLLIPWNLTTTNDPLAALLLAGEGYWPDKLENGVAVGKSLVKTSLVDFPKVCCGYVVEGFTENGTLIMRNLEKKNQSTGEPLVASFTETMLGQTVKYAMGSRGTYQFVQNQTHRYFKLGFAGLPVPWVVVSAHEAKGFDEQGNPFFGPVIVGKAMIDTIPQWFDHVIHFDKYEFEVPGTKIVRMGSRAYFTSHKDVKIPTITWTAKLGVEPYLMAHIYDKWPAGYIPLIISNVAAKGAEPQYEYTSSLRTLLELMDPVK